MIRVDLVKWRFASHLELRRQMRAIFAKVQRQADGYRILQVEREPNDVDYVRGVDIRIVLAKKPIPAGDQLRDDVRCRALAFSLYDRSLEIGNQLGVKCANQKDQALLAAIDVRKLLEVGNRPADAVLRNHQLQAFGRMYALAQRNIDQGLDMFDRF